VGNAKCNNILGGTTGAPGHKGLNLIPVGGGGVRVVVSSLGREVGKAQNPVENDSEEGAPELTKQISRSWVTPGGMLR